MKSKIIGAVFILLGVGWIIFMVIKCVGLVAIYGILIILLIVVGSFLVDDTENDKSERPESVAEKIESAINDVHQIENLTYRNICLNDTLLSCVDRFCRPDGLEPDMQVMIQLYYFGDDLDKIFNYSDESLGKISVRN